MKYHLIQAFCEEDTDPLNIGSGPAQKRFLQLIRRTVAYHEHYSTSFDESPLSHSDERAPWLPELSRPSSRLVLGFHQNKHKIRVFPIFGPDAANLMNLMHTQNGSGGLYYTTERHAFGLLSLKEDMAMSEMAHTSAPASDGIGDFWQKIIERLQIYRKVPFHEIHLFIGEMSFRYHRQNQALSPLLVKWMKETPDSVIKHM